MIHFYPSKQLVIEANICPIYRYEVVTIIIRKIIFINFILDKELSSFNVLFVSDKIQPPPPALTHKLAICYEILINGQPLQQRINYKMKIRALNYGNRRI